MNKHLIRLSSVTYAIRAQKVLEQRGIRSSVRKLAKNLSVHGCGYGLEIVGNLEVALQIITVAGIRIVEVLQGDEL